MPENRMIHVSPLSRLAETVALSGASHMVTLINDQMPVERPASIAPENHLYLGMNDIAEPAPGYTAPGEAHVEALLRFVHDWAAVARAPIVLHCWAGISRSTAAAYISACALRPLDDEAMLARRLRLASPSATPNPRLVALADALLKRQGRMVRAIAAIGRGEDAGEGLPFHFDVLSGS